MDWLRNIGRKKEKKQPDISPTLSEPSQENLEDPEMQKLLDTFTQTCWPQSYGYASLGVDTKALKALQGWYLEQAKTAILASLAKEPHSNAIVAADAIQMTEAIPVMVRWIEHIRSVDDRRGFHVAYSKLALSLYNFTQDRIYLADLAETITALGSGDISDSALMHSLWQVPVTPAILSAVWKKLSNRKKINETSSWVETCQDFLREKLDDPVGKAFLASLSDAEQKALLSAIAITRNQRIERNRRFERFVVERYDKSDLNRFGEYIRAGGSPVPGLTLRNVMDGHTDDVNCTSWSPDGSFLASAGDDNTVLVWDMEKADYVAMIDGGEIDPNDRTARRDSDNPIYHVGWSADGDWIAFGSRKNGISIWNVKQEQFLVPPKKDGKWVRQLGWAPGVSSLLYSFEDNSIWIQEIPSGTRRQIFQGYSGRIDALAWSSDGGFIAAGYWDGNKDSSHEILLWDVKQERVVARVGNHDGYINRITWIPDRPILAAASGDHTISIWNMQERQQLASLESHTSGVVSVSFSTGGVLLASTAERDDMIGGTVRLWRTDTGEELVILKELGSADKALAFHPSLPILASRCHGNPTKPSGKVSACSIRIWDVDMETFLYNPPFVEEFNRAEAELPENE